MKCGKLRLYTALLQQQFSPFCLPLLFGYHGGRPDSQTSDWERERRKREHWLLFMLFSPGPGYRCCYAGACAKPLPFFVFALMRELGWWELYFVTKSSWQAANRSVWMLRGGQVPRCVSTVDHLVPIPYFRGHVSVFASPSPDWSIQIIWDRSIDRPLWTYGFKS